MATITLSTDEIRYPSFGVHRVIRTCPWLHVGASCTTSLCVDQIAEMEI